MKRKVLFYVLPLTMAVQVALAGNLVTDGSFEGGVLSWTSTKAVLTLDTAAAYTGQYGMNINAAYTGCANGALYTLNTASLQPGKLYEFGGKIRLANGSGTSTDLNLGLIKNGGTPIILDGESNTYSARVYPDKWTTFYGIWKAEFASNDSLKVCVGLSTRSQANKTFYVDDIYVKPLTIAEVGYQPPSTLDSSTAVYADGNRLVMGPQKTPFVMKGVNFYLYAPGNDAADSPSLSNFQYKNVNADAYKEVRDLGFNSVRLMLSFNLFEENTAPGVYKEEGWALIDKHILWAKQNGLRLILDMHVPQGGYQSTTNTGFENNAAWKQRLENLWVAIAQRYRNETTIVGYDLINEPHINNWFNYAQTLINKIRVVDNNHLIIVEESFHPNDPGMYKLPDNNILYDIHWYEPWSWAGSLTNNTPYTGTLESFKQTIRQYYALKNFYNAATDRFTVPINIGEYGITYTKYETAPTNAVTWLQHANAAFDYFGINRQLFHYNEEKFGIYRKWNSYANEHTVTTTALKAALPAINGAAPPPPPPAPALDITTTSLANGTVGTAYSAQANASGGTTPYTWALVAGSLPTGLTLGSDGKISGTPSVAGTFNFTLGVTDKNAATDTQAVSMTIAAQPVTVPPDITTTSLTGGTVGIAYSTTLQVSNGTAPYSWSLSSGSLPAGLSLSSTGVISGTPTSAGTATFSVKVTDAKGVTDTQVLSLAIVAASPVSGNSDMALSSFKATKTSVTKGTAAEFSFVLQNNGNDTATNARFVLPLPANMAWVSGGNGSECSATTTQVTCNFGSLSKGTSRTRYLYLRPLVAGSYTLTGTATSDKGDSNLSNNSVTVTLTAQ